MYGQSSRADLLKKVDYELWFLDFLARKEDAFTGGANLTSLDLSSKKGPTNINIMISEVIGSGLALEVMGVVSPLTFVAAFKVIDMVFEWILEENHPNGTSLHKGPPSRWRFQWKSQELSESPVQYPLLMQSMPYIKEYLFALYDHLTEYRNEIVHRNNFSVSPKGVLGIEYTSNNQIHLVEIDRDVLGGLVHVASGVAKILAGTRPYNAEVESLLKYNFDKLTALHLLPGFGEMRPLKITVNFTSCGEGNEFSVDLAYVRDRVRTTYPNQNVFFDLSIMGIADDKPPSYWHFPSDAVPNQNELVLAAGAYEHFRTKSFQQ